MKNKEKTKMQTGKVDLRSMSVTEDQKRKLKKLFPEVFNEKHINWEKLKATLGEMLDNGREFYHTHWPGKNNCWHIIQKSSLGTLKPCKKESVDWNNTHNLFIEGDNLEVLKLLQESYYGKVKMIYIDPPYNTGKDFIYPDKYSENLETYLQYTGQKSREGKIFSTNMETDGRFHSKWLNMMFPRLYLAKNLLREDGVIFISIDDNEVANLRKICDEIFGEENFISSLSRIAKTTSFRGNYFAPSKDYILVYGKDIDFISRFRDDIDENQYHKIEKQGKRQGEKYRDDIAFYLSTLETRPNQRYFIECPDGEKVIPPGKTFPPQKPIDGDGCWRWNNESFMENYNFIVFKKSKKSPLIKKNGQKASWNIYTKSYLNDKLKAGNLPRDFITNFLNRHGTSELKKLNIPYDFPKPTKLVKFLIKVINSSKNSIILDFFAGSGTTAHAVYEKNREDGGNRKYILVQLPEPTQEKSEAYKAGFKNIADIGKERIRRAIKKIKEENQQQSLGSQDNDMDLGFKVFKLKKSHFKTWEQKSYKDQEAEKQMEMHLDGFIDPKASDEDILYEILLKTGYTLTTKINILKLVDQTVYSIDNKAFLICLERQNITKDLIKEMARIRPARVVFLDIAFENKDRLKTNAKETFASHGVLSFRTI